MVMPNPTPHPTPGPSPSQPRDGEGGKHTAALPQRVYYRATPDAMPIEVEVHAVMRATRTAVVRAVRAVPFVALTRGGVRAVNVAVVRVETLMVVPGC